MSEFSEKNSVTKLIGSPPGYVGYEEGGALTEKIRRHPYSIILFDEIEKAHTEVLDLFLQLADNGTLTDSSGRSVSFKNSYIILTSNIGADLSNDTSIGFVSDNTKNSAIEKRKIIQELEKHFRVEFINRIDEIILFKPINKDAMRLIAMSKLDALKIRLLSLGINIEFSESVSTYLANKTANEKFGARELIRLITAEIETPLSSFILKENTLPSSLVRIDVIDGKIEFSCPQSAPTS